MQNKANIYSALTIVCGLKLNVESGVGESSDMKSKRRNWKTFKKLSYYLELLFIP